MTNYLLDTNILIRMENVNDPQNEIVNNVVNSLLARGDTLHVTLQNLSECWNVFTRPVEKNGYGYSTDDARRMVEKFLLVFPALSESTFVVHRWFDLVQRYKVQGVQVHDTRLAAVMLENSITHLLTLNGRDFRRFEPEGLVIIDPHLALDTQTG